MDLDPLLMQKLKRQSRPEMANVGKTEFGTWINCGAKGERERERER